MCSVKRHRKWLPALWAVGAAALASPLTNCAASSERPNFAHVCLASNFQHATDLAALSLPRFTIFEDGGEFDGGSQQAWSKVDFKASTVNPNAALVTDQSAHLSLAQPCSDVPVKMWKRGESSPTSWAAGEHHIWDLDHAMGKPPIVDGQPSHVGVAAGSIAVRAVLLGDVDKWTEASEDDVAASDPNNPMSRVANDSAAAMQVPDDASNLQVCLSRDADEHTGLVTLPKGLIFVSYGKASGDPRSPGSDPNALALESAHYAVVLSKAVPISPTHPCATAPATVALSDDFKWQLPLVRRSDLLQFQVYGLERHLSAPLTGRLADLISEGMVNARPTADIGQPRQVASE